MLKQFLVTTLVIPLCLQFATQPAMAAQNFQAPVFYEVTSVESALSLVTAATGSDRFERDTREIFKTYKVDIRSPFIGMQFDGSKIRFEGLSEPVIVGASPYEFSYKGITYIYNPKRSTKANFEEMRKSWGQFKELNFPVAFFNPFMNSARADGGPLYAMLFSFVGVTAALVTTTVAVGSYFGYKWYKNSTEPLKLECTSNKIVQSKGKDRLVIEAQNDGHQNFYSEVNGKRDLQGDLEEITLRGKDSYAITNGNGAVNDLRTASAVELNKKLMAMKSVCANSGELERFNSSSRRIQDGISAGKIKVVPQSSSEPAAKDPDALSGIR